MRNIKIKFKEILMKKIVSLVLVAVLCCLTLAACTPAETKSEYTLAIAVDTAATDAGKVTNTAIALVLDKDGKIADVRFDCADATLAVAEGAVVAVESVVTKVEKGDAYEGMAAGSWEKQTKAFEDAIIGKTAAEVADLDATLISGCTMKSTVPTFKALVAKAAAGAKVSFEAGAEINLGLAISEKIGANGKVSADYAATVVEDGKVIACVIDSNEVAYTVNEDGTLTAGQYKGTKTEQGDSYVMPAGNWAKQAAAFTGAIIGKNAEELEAFEPVSDALAEAGCTMQNTTAGYKATIIKAVGYAK